jgi:hypothetical protein
MLEPGLGGSIGGATSRWEERRGSNLAWAVSALTTCNAVGPLGALSLRAGFLFGRIKPVVVLYSGRTFPALRFIHFASWSLITRLPGPDGGRLKSPYLLFLTNFNGDFEQYIDSFSYVIGSKISNIWRFSYGFPGPRPSEPFKAFIERQELVSLHYYSAYPVETTATVLSGLRVREHTRRLIRETGDAGPEAFAARYRRFLTDVQADL